jgi:acetyl esterase/lipase
MRQGMQLSLLSNNSAIQTVAPDLLPSSYMNAATGANYLPPSKSLILHAHGGGFIAHSSKSHEIYLKPWSKELKIPIVSIDYSLSPEVIFNHLSIF